MIGGRRTFGPVVLLGLAGGALAVVAGGRAAATAGGRGANAVSSGFVSYDAHQPLVSALGLVVLACWGVLLVTRGRVRRGVAALGAVASAGAAASALSAWGQVPDRLRDELAQVGIRGVAISHTAWWWCSLLAPLAAAVACVLAVRWAPAWPEMGSRYDAPSASPATHARPAAPSTGSHARHPTAEPSEQSQRSESADPSNLDLWKALDEGRDPTETAPE